jgi:hypothetical protein
MIKNPYSEIAWQPGTLVAISSSQNHTPYHTLIDDEF